jgi:hypothetical protein
MDMSVERSLCEWSLKMGMGKYRKLAFGAVIWTIGFYVSKSCLKTS